MIIIGVSIITSYYNREDYVTESIQSLLDQNYDEFEIIAIDDDSSDNTYKKLLEFNDDRLKVITHQNMGIVKSFIKAIALSKYKYIAIHGSGDISYPDRIRKQAEYLDKHKNIGLVSCNVENYSMKDHTSRILKYNIDSTNEMTNKLLKKNYFTQGEVMFRKDVYEKAGGYRPFFKYAQDKDLWLRMSLHTNFSKVDEVLYRRYLLEDGVSSVPKKRFLQAIYSSFATDCLIERMSTGSDFIDKYGNLATIHMNINRMNKRLVYLAFIYLFQDDVNSAEWVIRETRKSKITLKNTLAYTIIKLAKHCTILRKAVIKLLGWIRNSQNKKLNLVNLLWR